MWLFDLAGADSAVFYNDAPTKPRRSGCGPPSRISSRSDRWSARSRSPASLMAGSTTRSHPPTVRPFVRVPLVAERPGLVHSARPGPSCAAGIADPDGTGRSRGSARQGRPEAVHLAGARARRRPARRQGRPRVTARPVDVRRDALGDARPAAHRRGVAPPERRQVSDRFPRAALWSTDDRGALRSAAAAVAAAPGGRHGRRGCIGLGMISDRHVSRAVATHSGAGVRPSGRHCSRTTCSGWGRPRRHA